MQSEQRQMPEDQSRIIYVEQQTNATGTVGMVVAIIAFFLGWIPLIGWFIWFLGVVFSFAGLFKRPRTHAIIGMVVSFLSSVMLILMGTALLAFFAAFS